VDGQYRSTGGGNSAIWAPTWTCNKCEVDVTDDDRLTVVCGRRRADSNYPWMDRIILPDGTQIPKAAPDTVVVSHRTGDWGAIYYEVDTGAGTAELLECHPDDLPASTSTTFIVPLAMVWVVWSDYKSAYRIRSVVQQKLDPIVLVQGGSSYDGPFACTIAPNQTQILIGATRAASAWAQDYILVHPDSIVKNNQEIVGVSSSGVVYYEVKREDWDTAAISATPYFAATLPVSTSMYFMIPLAGVTFAGGIITSVRQLQYGNIIIDKTSADYCP
jgi:hypothetical protein